MAKRFSPCWIALSALLGPTAVHAGAGRHIPVAETSEKDIAALPSEVAGEAGGRLDPATMPDCKSDKFRDVLLGKHPDDQNREVLTLEQIDMAASEVTPDVRAALEKIHSLDGVAQELRRRKLAFNRSYYCLDTANVPRALMAKIRALPPHEPWVAPRGNRLVLSVTVKSVPAADAKDRSLSPMLTEAQLTAEDLLKDLEVEKEYRDHLARSVELVMPRLIRGNTERSKDIRRIASDELGKMLGKTVPVTQARYRDLLVQRFSLEELRELRKFFRSGLGRKFRSTLPPIQFEIIKFRQQAINAAVQASMPRIVQRMRDEKIAVPSSGT